MAKSARKKHQAKGRARRAAIKSEGQERQEASVKADLAQRPHQQLCSHQTTPNASEFSLANSQCRTDSGLGFQVSTDRDILGRSPTPALTFSTSSLPTEDEGADMNGPAISLALRTKKAQCPINIVHPVPARLPRNTFCAWEDNSFTFSDDEAGHKSPPDLARVEKAGSIGGHEPCRLAETERSTSWVIVADNAALSHAFKTAGNNVSESSSRTSNRGQTQGNPSRMTQRRTNQLPIQSGNTEEDLSALDDEDGGEGEPEMDSRRGSYRCIFCSTNGGRDHTQHCAWLREFPSQLKVHHFHQGHPGGPFGCCKKCYAIGDLDLDCESGNMVYIRFKSKEEVSTHERSCISHICIDDECHNYDRVPGAFNPCKHDAKHSGRQIWRMWYRRANALQRHDAVPEPDGSTGAGIPPSSSNSQTPSRPHLTTLVTPERPSTGPPMLQHNQYFGIRGIAPVTSPSVDPLTPLARPSRASSTSTSSQQGLQNLARALLVRTLSRRPFWSDRLQQLYDSAMDAATQRRERLANVDSDSYERINTMQILMEICRSVMVGTTERTLDAWLELNIAANAALSEPLADSPPRNWFDPAIEDQSQMLAFSGSFDVPMNVNMPYSTTLDMQGTDANAPDFNARVQNRVRAQIGIDINDRTQMPYTINPAYLEPGLRPVRRSDTQSIASAPNDSGNYSAEGTTDQSGGDKDPGARRPSMPIVFTGGYVPPGNFHQHNQ